LRRFGSAVVVVALLALSVGIPLVDLGVPLVSGASSFGMPAAEAPSDALPAWASGWPRAEVPPFADGSRGTAGRWLGVAAVVAVLAGLLAAWAADWGREGLAAGRALARWLRIAAWLAAAHAVVVGIAWLGGPAFGRALATAGMTLGALASLEIAARVAARAAARVAGRAEAPVGGQVATPGLLTVEAVADGFLPRLLASRWSPLGSIFHVLTDAFGVDLKGTWALEWIRRSLVPLALGIAFLGWLGTAVVVVRVDERGVLERFGRLVRDEPLTSGLHVVFPWPIDRLRRVAVDRVESLTIGYAGRRVGASLLWTQRHSETEYSLLVGEGTDLVTVNGVLYWKVRDPVRHVYAWQNPGLMLQAVADRVLMRSTQNRRLDEVLAENVEALAARMQDAIQDEAASAGLVIAVVDLALIGLHPPVEVATAYQSVVSAGIERRTRVFEGRSYRGRELPRASSDAARQLADAESERVRRVEGARGFAESFTAQDAWYRAAPRLFTTRRRLEAMERHLNGRRFTVIDDRIQRDGGAVWMLE